MNKKAKPVLCLVVVTALISLLVRLDVLAYEGPSDLESVSPKVSVPEKDLNRARELIKLEPYGKQIFMDAHGIELPEPKDFTYVKYEREAKSLDMVTVSNDYVLALAKSLDVCAGERTAKSNYAKAAELLKSAIVIIKDSDRNALELERYQTEYNDLLKKMNKQK